MIRRSLSLVVLAGVALSESAWATNYTGTINFYSVTTAGDGMTRVSVYTNGTTAACGYPNIYAFEFSNSNQTGQAMLATIVSEKLAGGTIVISGQGQCDAYNTETLLYLEGH